MHRHRLTHEPIRLGPFDLDLGARELRKDGQRVRLQDKPFEVLAALVERAGQVVSREELRERLWADDTFVVFDDSLNTAIRKAREALGDAADAPKFIETVPRRGYRYVGPLVGNGHTPPEPAPPPPAPTAVEVVSRRSLPLSVRLTLAIGIAAVAIWAARAWRVPAAEPAAVSFHIQPPDSTSFPWGSPRVEVSPDGRQVAFLAVSRHDRVPRVWIQSLASPSVRPLPGTEGVLEAVWSPDGTALAFRDDTRILRYDLPRGTVTPVCESSNQAVGLSWSDQAGILFANGQGHALYRVEATGGIPEAVTALDPALEERMHTWPEWLPDGRSFLYVGVGQRPNSRNVYLGRLGVAGRRLIVAGANKPKFTTPGFLLYSRQNQVVAQRFDPAAGSLSGAIVEVVSDVAVHDENGGAGFSVSGSGVLAHSRPPRLAKRELVWMNSAGQPIATVAEADHYVSFSLSPDERFAVLQSADVERTPPSPDLWLLDLVRGIRTRVTNNPGNDEGGVWSPDSRQFLYARHAGINRPAEIFLKHVDDPDRDDRFLTLPGVSAHPFDWSRDGRFVLFGLAQKGGRQDIWVWARDRGTARYPWLATAEDESEARFSPDGRWVAYQSEENGRREVFVRAFDPPGSRRRISAGGGTAPQWSRDGTALYFMSSDYRLMAVSVRGNGAFVSDAPRPLFELRRLEAMPQSSTPYAVGGHHRFLVGSVVDAGGDSPITVVLNWERQAVSR